MQKLFIAVFLAVLVAGCSPGERSDETPRPSENPENTPQQNLQGRAVFGITDAAADMGAVSKVEITVESVQVQSQGSGWVTVTEDAQTYDLLELKNQNTIALLANANLSPGTYNQIRLEVSEVIVTDDQGEHEARLPSGDLRLNGDLTVAANTTSSAVFDFIVDESLHVTGNGEYIMAPVIQVETRERADIQIQEDFLVISGGRIRTNVKVGMNEEGRIDVGLSVPVNATLGIDGGRIKVNNANRVRANATIDADVDISGIV